jgi:hypothetical protein
MTIQEISKRREDEKEGRVEKKKDRCREEKLNGGEGMEGG